MMNYLKKTDLIFSYEAVEHISDFDYKIDDHGDACYADKHLDLDVVDMMRHIDLDHQPANIDHEHYVR